MKYPITLEHALSVAKQFGEIDGDVQRMLEATVSMANEAYFQGYLDAQTHGRKIPFKY